jgi:hypothetical protein
MVTNSKIFFNFSPHQEHTVKVCKCASIVGKSQVRHLVVTM